MSDEPTQVKWYDLLKPISLEVGKPKHFKVLREAIPLIFVPGIMGTRLRRSSGEKMWDPDSAWFMLWNYGMKWVDAADKKSNLVGRKFDKNYLVPFNDDAEHNEEYLSDYPRAADRGWGGVAWSSYGEILSKLQDEKSWGEPVRSFFRFPVYAFGYNWSASNLDAGKLLKKLIDDVIKENNQAPSFCEHVILVTHSMGGLVSRAACIKEGASSRVLGIVHGVQPVTGAPAAYWRMKAGFERSSAIKSHPSAWVLGTNGEEVTALLGHMPGGLQLLPGPTYKDNQGSSQWLRLKDHTGKEIAALPKSDPYSEIYANEDQNDFYRLIHKPFLLPEKTKQQTPDQAWQDFLSYLREAKGFHSQVGMQQHAETQAFYGAGKSHPTPDDIGFKMSPYGWKEIAGRPLRVALNAVAVGGRFGVKGIAAYLGYEALTHSDYWQLRGGFKTRVLTRDGVTVEVELQPAAGAGDATVPESSGKALKPTGQAASGSEAEPFDGVEHEPAYHEHDPEHSTVQFTLACVERLCWLKINRAAK